MQNHWGSSADVQEISTRVKPKTGNKLKYISMLPRVVRVIKLPSDTATKPSSELKY